MKKWFIIEEDNHLGPFSDRNLVNLFNKKKIFEETQIWCEELVEPTSYREEFLNKMNQVFIEMKKKDEPEVPIIRTLPPDLPEINLPLDEDKEMTMISLDKEMQDLELELEEKLTTPAIEENEDQTEIIPPPPIDIPSAEDLEAKKIISNLKRNEREKLKKKIGEVSPTFDGIDESQVKEKLIEEDLKDQPPPPVEELSIKELRSLYEDETKEERSKRLKKVWSKRLLLLCMPILGFAAYVAFEYFSLYRIPFTRPQKMSTIQYRAATKFLAKAEDLNSYQFFISKDREEIYLITPNKAFGEVLVEFNLIRQESLASSHIAFEGSGRLEHNLLILSKFEFSQGKKIEDGFYEVRIRSMEKLQTKFVSNYIETYPRHLDHFDKFLLSVDRVEEFKRKLNQEKKRKEKNQASFFQELLEKYLTLKNVTIQIIGDADTIFNDITPEQVKEKAKEFEEVYKVKYGQIFTSFVMSNKQDFEKVRRSKFKQKEYVISEYNRLSEFARKLGEDSMNFLSQMEQYDQKTHGDFNLYYQTAIQELVGLKEELQYKEDEIRTTFDL